MYNLQEAYLGVYYDLDEAIDSEGRYYRTSGNTPSSNNRTTNTSSVGPTKPTKSTKPSPSPSDAAAERRKQIASKMLSNRTDVPENYDLYDLIFDYLLDEANRIERHLNLSPDETVVRRQNKDHPRGAYDRIRGSGQVKGGDPSLGVSVWKGGRQPDGDLDRGRGIAHDKSRGVKKNRGKITRSMRGPNDNVSNYLSAYDEQADLYDLIFDYLLDEGYADTEEAATVIMANMSEEWRQNIIESEEEKKEQEKPFTGEGPKKPKGWKPKGPKRRYGQRPPSWDVGR